MDDKLTASLTPAQWDYLGKLLADTINVLAPQVRTATAIMQSLQGQLQAQAPAPKPNGVKAAEAEVLAAPS